MGETPWAEASTSHHHSRSSGERCAATDISVCELWTLATGRKIEPAPKLGENEGDVSRPLGLLRQVSENKVIENREGKAN